MADAKHYVVIGAGPAGLTAAWQLANAGQKVTVLERSPQVGGLGGTHAFEGKQGRYYFDYGGHRFITHNPQLLTLVDELLGDDLLMAQRHSVIRLQGRVYDYPLNLRNLLGNAPWSLLLGASRDMVRRKPSSISAEASFADWTKARFGPTLYQTFFAGYTAKLWGIPPEQLSGDWAQQRISLVDLKDVARRLLPGKNSNVRTYARSYRYPRYGFGMIFERLAAKVKAQGVSLRSSVTVTGFSHQQQRIHCVHTDQGDIACDGVISTVPLPTMVKLMGHSSPLRFRGLRFFHLTLTMDNVSPWTWQYLSDPNLLGTRLQEPKRRSPHMAPKGMTSLMVEIPCNPDQALWQMPDDDLYPKILADLAKLGIDTHYATGEYFSTRQACAYPLLDLNYRKQRQQAFDYLDQWQNLIQCGRQGCFRYVFTDTAMEMGQMAAQSILQGEDWRQRIREHRNEAVVIETESIA